MFAAQLVALTFPHKHTEGLRGPGVQRRQSKAAGKPELNHRHLTFVDASGPPNLKLKKLIFEGCCKKPEPPEIMRLNGCITQTFNKQI